MAMVLATCQMMDNPGTSEPNAGPVVTYGAGASSYAALITETANSLTESVTSGEKAFAVTDPDGDTLTFALIDHGMSRGSKADSSKSNYTYSIEGTYGSLFINFTTMKWEYFLGVDNDGGSNTLTALNAKTDSDADAVERFRSTATDAGGSNTTVNIDFSVSVTFKDETLFNIAGTWGTSNAATAEARAAELMVTGAELGSGIEAQGTLAATLAGTSTAVAGAWSASSTANRGGGTAGNYGNFSFDSGAPGAWSYDIDPTLVTGSSVITETITVTFTSTAQATMGETQTHELEFSITNVVSAVANAYAVPVTGATLSYDAETDMITITGNFTLRAEGVTYTITQNSINNIMHGTNPVVVYGHSFVSGSIGLFGFGSFATFETVKNAGGATSFIVGILAPNGVYYPVTTAGFLPSYPAGS